MASEQSDHKYDTATAAEAFRRSWLWSYSAFVGPPTALLILWVTYEAGWPALALLASAVYVVFNVVWSRLESKDLPVTRGSHPRAIGNLLLQFPIGLTLGHVPGSWVILVPTVFGSMGCPTSNQSRYVFSMALTGFVSGALLDGAPTSAVLLAGAGLTLAFLCAEQLYVPLVQSAVEARRRQEQLETALDEVERALDIRKAFLATMSHEIRTPMNGVLGMAELLTSTSLDDEQQDMLRIIRSSGEGLLQIINDILDISKLEAGQMAIEAVSTNPVRVTREVITLLELSSATPTIPIRLHVADVPEQVQLDPTRFRQVLLNLVGNARKFTPEGQVDVRLRWSDERLQVAVEDTGIGITREAQGRLFNAFMQAEAGTSRRFGGTGLGLAINQRLVNLMGGAIRVESEVGVGSTFFFSLPAPAATPAPVEPPERLPAAQPEWGALVVDDNPVNRQVAAAMLARLGCRVEQASSGEEAVALVSASPAFDIVFMDCQLPGMDGLQTSRRLRDEGHSVPIVALTAGDTETERQECAAAGMDDIVAKPTDLKSLHTALSRWAGQTSAARIQRPTP